MRDFVVHAFEFFRLATVQDDTRPMGGKRESRGAADSLSGAGDENYSFTEQIVGGLISAN
jgi:hypothetical protein